MLACKLALFSSRGLALLECSMPLTSFSYTGAVPREALIVFLPGMGDLAEDFQGRGFVDALMRSGLKADAIAVDAHYGYYARRSVLERLAEDVVIPARAQGYGEVWLVGISMGGIGALSYVMHHPGHIARALLLAPYLGEPAWIREAAETEDPTTSPPAGSDAQLHVRRLWRWIRQHHREQAVRPRLYLGYGSRDPFAKANALFATHLPPGHVLAVAGGHDWRTWARLWQAFLAMWTAEASTGMRF